MSATGEGTGEGIAPSTGERSEGDWVFGLRERLSAESSCWRGFQLKLPDLLLLAEEGLASVDSLGSRFSWALDRLGAAVASRLSRRSCALAGTALGVLTGESSPSEEPEERLSIPETSSRGTSWGGCHLIFPPVSCSCHVGSLVRTLFETDYKSTLDETGSGWTPKREAKEKYNERMGKSERDKTGNRFPHTLQC